MSFSWERDSIPQPKGKRLQVVLQAFFFTPIAIALAAAFVLAIIQIASGETGYVVLLVVSGFVGFIFGFQALHYIRDMSAELAHTEGDVSKKWTKGNLFFFFLPSYYIAVKGQIFTISRNSYRGLLEDDQVRIRHYPHTLTVEFIERYDESEKKFIPAGHDADLR